MRLTRRSLLAGAALWPLAGRADPLGTAAAGDAFQDVVRHVGGVAGVPQLLLDAVERAFVARYGETARRRFTAALRAAPLDAALAGNPALAEQAQFVAGLLYSGEVEHDGVTTADYYPWSLAWSALAFAKAPGICGGPAFGHWAHPPGAEPA